MIVRATIIPCLRLPRQLGFFDYTHDIDQQGVLRMGMFVDIPFRNKTITGVVINISPEGITDKLKPTTAIRTDISPLPTEEIEYITRIAHMYCVSPATILRIHYPAPLTKASKRKQTASIAAPSLRKQQTLIHSFKPTLFHYQTNEECVAYYRALIAATHKKKEQLIIITPSDTRTRHLVALLPQSKNSATSSIEDGIRATKTLRQGVLNGNTAVVIGTRHILALPYQKINTIIVDQSEHRSHKLHEGSPLIETCTAAYHKARLYHSQLIYASCAPRLEEYSYIPCTHPQTSNVFIPALISLHDEFRGGNATHISDRLREEISLCLEQKKDAILSLNHTGMSKYIMCKGCKTTVSCPTCVEPLRYTQKGQLLSCPTCTYTQIPPDVCPVCGDVNFSFPGLGIEKIAQQLVKEFPNTPIRTVDAKNPLLDSDSPAIVVGTSYLTQHYPARIADAGLIGIISADPIVSMDQFRSLEQQWQDHAALLALLSPTARCVIQAFNTDHPFVQSLRNMDYHRFANNELALRTTHSLPPSVRHITCVYKGDPNNQTETQTLTATIDKSHIIPIVTLIPRSPTRPHAQVLISLPTPYDPAWDIPESIHEILVKLSVDWMIDPDPRIL